MLSEKEGQTGVQSAGSPNKTTQDGGSQFPKPLSTSYYTSKVSFLSCPSFVSSLLSFSPCLPLGWVLRFVAKIKTTVLKYDGTRQDPADFPKIDVIKMFLLFPSFCLHLLFSNIVKNIPLWCFQWGCHLCRTPGSDPALSAPTPKIRALSRPRTNPQTQTRTRRQGRSCQTLGRRQIKTWF